MQRLVYYTFYQRAMEWVENRALSQNNQTSTDCEQSLFFKSQQTDSFLPLICTILLFRSQRGVMRKEGRPLVVQHSIETRRHLGSLNPNGFYCCEIVVSFQSGLNCNAIFSTTKLKFSYHRGPICINAENSQQTGIKNRKRHLC